MNTFSLRINPMKSMNSIRVCDGVLIPNDVKIEEPATAYKKLTTIEEYLVAEKTSEQKYEFFQGVDDIYEGTKIS